MDIRKIGYVDIKSPDAIIADPSYRNHLGSNYVIAIPDMKMGKWQVNVMLTSDQNIIEIDMIHEHGIPSMTSTEVKKYGVDSGIAAIFGRDAPALPSIMSMPKKE